MCELVYVPLVQSLIFIKYSNINNHISTYVEILISGYRDKRRETLGIVMDANLFFKCDLKITWSDWILQRNERLDVLTISLTFFRGTSPIFVYVELDVRVAKGFANAFFDRKKKNRKKPKTTTTAETVLNSFCFQKHWSVRMRNRHRPCLPSAVHIATSHLYLKGNLCVWEMMQIK